MMKMTKKKIRNKILEKILSRHGMRDLIWKFLKNILFQTNGVMLKEN